MAKSNTKNTKVYIKNGLAFSIHVLTHSANEGNESMSFHVYTSFPVIFDYMSLLSKGEKV